MATLEAHVSEKIFPSLDADEIAAELDVEKRAQDDGSQDRPATSDTALSGVEREIVADFQKRLVAAKNHAHQILQDRHGQRINLDLDLGKVLGDVNILEGQLDNRLRTLQIQRKSDLKELGDRYESTQSNLRLFKAKHKLSYTAYFSESNIWFWGFLALIVVAESILNATFFAKGSDLGLLGGIAQAIIISIINVAFAVWGAEVLRQCYHRQFPWKMIGFIGMSFYVGIVVCFNLLVAHYRAQVDLDPFEAVVATLQAFKADPLGIDNFQAWLLFIIGIVCAGFAFWKRFSHKDPYPGYSQVTKANKDAELMWIDARNGFLQELESLHEESQTEFNELRIQAKRIIVDYDRLLNDSRFMIDQFKQYAFEVENVCHAVLTRYRTINRSVRNTNAPEYFSERPKFEDAVYEFTADFKQDEEQLHVMRQKLVKYTESRFEDIRRGLQDVYMRYLESVDSSFGEIKSTSALASQENPSGSLDLQAHRFEVVNAAAAPMPKQTYATNGQLS